MRPLVVFPNLRAVPRAGGRLVLTQKFVDGMTEYSKNWLGPVRLVVEPMEQESFNLDNIEIGPGDLPVSINVLRFDDPQIAELVRDCAIGYGGVDHRQNHLSRLFRRINIPFVYGTEYTLRTRLQIARAEVANPIRALWRAAWEIRQEWQQRAAIKFASGLQCNGTPTFDAYKDLTPSPFLFFDTRVTKALQISAADLEARLAGLGTPQRKLRLAFSGRFAAMKGADQTIEVARQLRDLGVSFELVLYGGGPQEQLIRKNIAKYRLEEQVSLAGVLEFKTQLVPLLRRTDIFVCCHPQGDPSCTYLETFACGVPIAGYANEAFTGILARADVGVSTPINRPDMLARSIATLAADVTHLAKISRKAVEFARDNDFESTFKRRIDHLHSLAKHT
jgi:glycosyltransferase involved in cell wall biosynthesis